MTLDPRLQQIADAQPYPLVFATISGAHLYGFPSPDSDFDLRGAHVLPLPKVVGLTLSDETVEDSRVIDGLEMDIVSHDVRKFFGLLLKKNGYVLEQVLSPLVVRTSAAHEELRAIADDCVTRHHAHHYLGFSETQWKLWQKESPRRIKPLLYVYRVLLTGIWLMRTGEVQANVTVLNREFRLPQIDDLVARKTAGAEQQTIEDQDMAVHERAYGSLSSQLEEARDSSKLRERPSEATFAQLDDLLVRLRTSSGKGT
ncbi:nucleotidyltransferase domain-containing protein [Synoicihabitans lomoniglobus]|uniref:Nucleotidyltransferase domain-containing protein n=1 Tax=Synoicihabitans lomoniglobus TaxID=2909285 RepID=A0AAF0A0L3_9BACT|nr:nucleotidyltransferase domain-containing protein [Opitutaceae bacterium LMO-M01]WED65083.1 nucleotidyltransferase domain-containing protein [Opitutaceae bacterium LMO-M01]